MGPGLQLHLVIEDLQQHLLHSTTLVDILITITRLTAISVCGKDPNIFRVKVKEVMREIVFRGPSCVRA